MLKSALNWLNDKASHNSTPIVARKHNEGYGDPMLRYRLLDVCAELGLTTESGIAVRHYNSYAILYKNKVLGSVIFTLQEGVGLSINSSRPHRYLVEYRSETNNVSECTLTSEAVDTVMQAIEADKRTLMRVTHNQQSQHKGKKND